MTISTARTDRLSKAHQRLTSAIEHLVGGSDWQEMLDVARRFHAYSTNNILLIGSQRPDATHVAGFHTWKSLGHSVKKGEKGIAILAPLVTRTKSIDAREETDQPELVKVLRGFRVVYVFDVTQTEGEPLPEVAPTLLMDTASDSVWDALAAQIGSAGFTLQRGDCHGANGVTDFLTRTVTVRSDVGDAQAAKTLAHELAHVLLHDTPQHRGCRDRAEVEAESVAYLFCQHVGITSDNYSFPYIARWSDGDTELVRSTADRVITCARRIVEALG